jgi:metal-sulfur cluster biosynthetic enzyme
MDLVAAYTAAHETDEGKEGISARVNQFFRNSLVTMRCIQAAATNNDVESAVAEIGRTRVHYADVSLERCMELRPELSVFLQWCIGLRDRSARDRTRVSWKALTEQWISAPAFDPSINVKSISSMGIVTASKINTVKKIEKEESCRLSRRVGQSGTRAKVGKRRRANSGGSSGESSDGGMEPEQAELPEGRPVSPSLTAASLLLNDFQAIA